MMLSFSNILLQMLGAGLQGNETACVFIVKIWCKLSSCLREQVSQVLRMILTLCILFFPFPATNVRSGPV